MASIQPRGHTPRCVACDLWQGLPKGSHRRLSQVLFLGFHRMGRATSPRRWPASASASSLAPQRSIGWKAAAAQRRPHHRSCEGKGARFLYKLGENSTKTDEQTTSHSWSSRLEATCWWSATVEEWQIFLRPSNTSNYFGLDWNDGEMKTLANTIWIVQCGW